MPKRITSKKQAAVKKKITKIVIDTATPRAERYNIQDSEISGFAVRIMPTGHKTYVLDYREGSGRSGRRRTVTIGNATVMTPDQARKDALELLSQISKGVSPAAIRDQGRDKLIFNQVVERYFKEYATKEKKLSSVRSDRCFADRYLLPVFGRHKVDTITRHEILMWHRSISNGAFTEDRAMPTTANRSLALMRRIMTLCEEWWSLIPYGSNPCRGVKMNEEVQRDRILAAGPEIDKISGHILGPGEMERFLRACQQCIEDGSEHPGVIYLFLTQLLVGARPGEIQNLKISEVHLDKGYLVKEDHKGRRRHSVKPKYIQLNSLAIALLRHVLQTVYDPSQEWVFESTYYRGRPYNNLTKAWHRLCKRAQISDFSRHDLRHTFSSVLANSDVPPQVIQGLLGHSDLKTTQTYIHMLKPKLRQETEIVAKVVAEHFVVPEMIKSSA